MQSEFWEALSDTLIPGDGVFPSASAAGVVEGFQDRLLKLRGESHLTAILDALSAGGAFTRLDEAARVAAMTDFASLRHVIFEEMLAVLYLTYYESPMVTIAVKCQEPDYHNPPQPNGYAMSTFDNLDPLEFPNHGRGHYVPTSEVKRVELSGLAHLAAPIDHP